MFSSWSRLRSITSTLAEMLNPSNLFYQLLLRPNCLAGLTLRASISNESKLPRKPMTPFLRFNVQRKADVKGSSNMNAAQISSIVAKEWKTTDKTKYIQEYIKEKEEYDRLLKEYNDSLTDEQRQYLAANKEIKKRKNLLKQLRKTSPPTKPRNSANLYFKERSQEISKEPGQSQADLIKIIFEEYRNLSEESKAKYIGMAEKDKKRYESEMEVWYASIVEDPSIKKSVREEADKLKARSS